tara:strand:+ start:580 stop:1011 length:432 start_codon:yes stop_codon:yes gene_type:complete
MAAIRGNNGVLTIGSGKVASLTSYTLDTTQDTAETSAMGSTGRTYVKTMHGYSGSADFIFEGPDASAQQTTIAELEFATDTAETATMTLFPDSDDGTDARTASTSIAGNIIITGYSLTASFDGVVTGSLTFQGTGTLAYTAAS